MSDHVLPEMDPTPPSGSRNWRMGMGTTPAHGRWWWNWRMGMGTTPAHGRWWCPCKN